MDSLGSGAGRGADRANAGRSDPGSLVSRCQSFADYIMYEKKAMSDSGLLRLFSDPGVQARARERQAVGKADRGVLEGGTPLMRGLMQTGGGGDDK